MKKTFFIGMLSIGLGFFLGNIFMSEKSILQKNWNKEEKYYFIQEGIYSSYENLKNNLISIKQKVIDQEKDKYYVYVGITKDKKLASKIKDIYQKRGINSHTIEKYLDSEEFLQNVLQFDNLIKKTEDEEDILTIESVVLANYEEILKKE
ncbi:MAG: hypothetical protein IKE70_03170 [Bacilli bacterium]|nr:hypothetical protein [Bacilli bacterium]